MYLGTVRCTVACLAWVLTGDLCRAVPQQEPERQAEAAQIDRLIRQLGSEEFQERRQAMMKLREIGPAVSSPLRKAARGSDVEVRRRSLELLEEFEAPLLEAPDYGAVIERNGKLPDRPIVYVSLGCGTKPEWLRALAYCDELERLNLKVTDEGQHPLQCLRGKNHLRILNLYGIVTDDALVDLKGLPALQNVSITSPNVKGSGLRFLAGLKTLRFLTVESVSLGDEAFESIAKMTSLNHLTIGGGQFSDDALIHLQKLPKLTKVFIAGAANLTDNGIAHLGKCSSPDLTQIRVFGPKITPKGLALAEEYQKRNRKARQ
jgi:hypothetical protein